MKKSDWLIYGALFLVTGLSLYFSFSDSASLSDCSTKTTGIVTDKYRTKSKGYRVRYEYRVDGKAYENTEIVQGERLLSIFKEGTEVHINYSCSDYSIARIDNDYYMQE